MLLASTARADPSASDQPVIAPPNLHTAIEEHARGPDIRYDLRVDLPLALGGYVAWRGLEALDPVLAPRSCRWCDNHLNGFDAGARNALRWGNHLALADGISNVDAALLAPAVGIGLSAVFAAYDDRFPNVPIDIVLVYEAVDAAGIVTEGLKVSVGRMRPDTRALSPADRPQGSPNDAYLSFPSGHTSNAFSMVTAGATVASMRHYPGTGWIWAGGLLVATTTGYLRIAADKHYASDVLTGAVIGAGLGVGIPYFAHHPTQGVPITPRVQAVPGGFVIGARADL